MKTLFRIFNVMFFSAALVFAVVPMAFAAGSCPGSFFDYENKEWIQDYTCEDVGQNLIGEGFDHNVLTDGCSCMCDPFDAAFNPVAANACIKGEIDACADVCIPLDLPCDYGQRPYVVDGIAQCGYYFDPEFGLIDYYGSQRWREFLDVNGMSAGYMSPTGELLPCDGDGVKEAGDGTGRCVCADGGWFLMDGGVCVQELPVDLMLDPEGTQNYANLKLDFWHNPFNLANEGYGLPDGGAGLTLDQIMDMVNGQGTQMFDHHGEWTYTPMGTGTQYIYKSIPLVGYPVYSGTSAPVVVKVNLDFQGGNSSWSEFYYVYGRTTPGPFFNSSSVQTPINNSVINKPTRTGYTFGGYYTSTNGNGQQYVDENGVISNNLVYYTSTTPLTLYAKWTPNTYTISYNLNSGTHGASHPTSATYDTSFTVSNPTRSGYTFSGWKITGMDSVTHTYGNSTTASNSISSTTATTFKNLRSTSGTVTFTAQWTQNIPTCYQIHFDNATNGGSGGTTDIWLYRNSSNLSDSKNCKIYSDSACTNVITSITPPTKLNGFYIGQYSVTGVNAESPYNEGWFDTGGGSHIAEDRNYCNNTTNTSGYFNDLDYTYGFQGNQSPAITLRALFECTPGYYNNSDNRCLANTVVLDWQESGGNSIPDGSCTYGGNLVLPSAPSRSGYTFTGWRLADGTMANAGTTITGGCVVGYTNAYNGTSAAITAQWSQGTYTVSFNANGGTGGQSANVSATYGSAMPTISTTAPTRTGYTFDGWYDSVSLPSGYKKLEYIAKNNASQYIQTDYVGNLNSRYEGAVLLTNNTDAYDIASRVNASGNTRNIAFACSGSTSYIGYGTYISAATNRHQCVLNDRMDFVTDYLNRQWSVSIGNSTSTKQMSSDAITSFTNTAPLQIFFNRVAGATSTASYAAPIGTRIYYLKIYENNNLVHHFVPAKRSSDNAIGVYDVVENEFLTNAIANTGSFTAGPETNLEVKYYNANGTSAKNWDKTANTTLYARWTAKTYTVSFNANGGTGGQTADVTATYGAAMPTLGANSAPTRTGYYLVGWYDKSDYTASGAMQYYNANGTSAHNWDKTANTTLYAGWDGIKYMITLDDEANGGTSGSGSVIQKYASRWTTNDNAQTTITSVNIPKRTNSIFNGYYSAKTNGTQHIPATGVLPANTTFTDDTTLYAQFSSCQCSAGTGVDTCTTSSTTSNTCTATATCKVGYEEPVASCTGANCTSSCTPQKYTISIKPNGGKINDSVNNFEFYELYNTEFRDLTGTNVLTDIPVAVRDGYSLTGYFTASTGGTLKIGSDGLLPVPSTFMGDTTLYAQWAQDVITCTAGNYLPANSTSCATCPAGYYCPNTGNYVQSSSNQGIVSCASGKITETAGSTSASQCKSPEFSMTTTSLAAGTVFSFTMSAQGNFVIDWGDGNIQQITRTNTTDTTYSHTYTTAGTYTIGLSGQATGYNTNTAIAAISFSGNTNIAGISGSLGAVFGTLSSGTNKQPRFYQTFANCSNLTGSIPSGLFSGISGAPVNQLFAYTFADCSGLTGSIPENLFSGVSGPLTNYLFTGTFMGCSGLTGFVPQNLFDGFTKTSASAPMYHVFNGTGLATACPAGYYQYITGFEADFNSKVACTPCPTGYTSGVGATANTGCYLTVDGGQVRDGTSGTTLSTCAAGTYKTSHNEYYGTSYSCDTCPTTNPYSPAGAADAGACGRKLHIGDNVMYLRSTQKTTPSLKFDFNKDGVADLFGNMSTSSKKMSSGVDKSFKVNYGGQVYYIHDDTVQ
ncbi:MAG: InlB B-repeat-containing protein [Proteobacteria bacterium]|nr:InlB B-repeat-containing protein [Candidatus Enterousia onthequi]